MDNRVTPNLIETKNYRKKKDPKKRTLAIVAGALAASVLVMGVYFIAKPHEHGFSPWQMVLEPTCESEGERERVCAGCDFHEIEAIPPAGHTEVTELGYAPTVTENGLSDRIYCSACDKVLQEHTVIKATGSEGLEYREETGVIIITGLGTCKDTYLVVPAEIDGVPVTTINSNAFEGGTFKSVSIPQSVGMIGAEAFKDCKSLESITIPEKVRYIYDDTFNGCTKLSRVTIPDTIEYIGQNAFYGCASLCSIAKEGQTGAVIRVEEINPYTFYGCTSLMSVNLGSTRVIGESAFEGCTSLTNITWYEGVEFINANAFRGIAATDVSLPKSVIYIHNGAFADCESLININFSGTMEEWHSMGRSSDWKNADIHINCTDGTAEHIKTTIEGVPPTDTENGLSNGIVCNICGEVLEEQKVIHAGSQGLYYNVNEDGETCTVMDINMFEGTELIVPQYIDGYRVTAIGSQAFKGCAHLTSVVIPEGVTMIGSSAFEDCTSLENVALPESLTFIDTFAFNSCTELRTIVLPEKLEVINGSAFKQSGITSIEIPASVKSIGSEAFYYCESLENVTLHDGLETIGDSVFNGCASLKEITVPASVTEMGYSTFAYCTALESAHINANIEVLDGTFNGCESLATVTIPEGLKSIKFSTFSGCKSLTKVELPEGLLHIENYAFQNCQNLEEADIPSSVTEIGERAFAFCRKLKSISVPAGVRVVGDYAFAYCNAVTTLTIASGVEEIGVNSFAGVSASEITIPATVKKIGSGAFSTVYADYFVYEGTVAEWSAIDKADDWYSGMEIVHGWRSYLG